MMLLYLISAKPGLVSPPETPNLAASVSPLMKLNSGRPLVRMNMFLPADSIQNSLLTALPKASLTLATASMLLLESAVAYRHFSPSHNNTTPPRSFSDCMQVACGECHSVALTSDGRVWTWGGGGFGQLGIGKGGSRGGIVAVELGAGGGVCVCVAAGAHHTVAVVQGARARTWRWSELHARAHTLSQSCTTVSPPHTFHCSRGVCSYLPLCCRRRRVRVGKGRRGAAW